MPIEFYCSGCAKLLRVADENAGREAECPSCGSQVVVPPGGVGPFTDADTGGHAVPGKSEPLTIASPTPSGADNPYASPAGLEATLPYAAWAEPAPIQPTLIDLGDVLSQSWEIFKMRAGLLIGVGLIVLVITLGLAGLGVIVDEGIGRNVSPFAVANHLFRIVVGVFLGIGQSMIFLKVARGQKAEVAEFFAGGRFILPIIGGSILYGLMCTLGLLCLIVPGIILIFMFGQYHLLIIDREIPVLDSFSMSQQLTSGNKLALLGLWIVLLLLGLAVGFVTCGVGFVVFQPYAMLVAVVAYLMMSGQPLCTEQR